MKFREICMAAACVATLSACMPPPVRHGGPGYGYGEGGPRHGGGPGRDNGGYGGDHRGPEGGRYSRGDRLPDQYRGDGYAVRDWRGQGLDAPPEGQRWVRVGDQLLLVAIATGIISSILFLGGGR